MPRHCASQHKIKPSISCGSKRVLENHHHEKSYRKGGQGQDSYSTAALVKSPRQYRSTIICQEVLGQSQLTKASAKNAVPTTNDFINAHSRIASTSTKPGYAITCPLPFHIYGPYNHKNFVKASQLIHLTYPSLTSQNSAFSRISAFSESRDYVGQYLGLNQIHSERIQLCKGYIAHNISVEKVATWLLMMWNAEMCNSSPGPAGQSLDKEWWLEFTTPEERQLVKVLIKLGVLWIRLNGHEVCSNEERISPGVENSTLEKSTEYSYPGLEEPTISIDPFFPSVHDYNKSDTHRSSKHNQPSPYIISQISQTGSSSSRQTTAHELAHYAYHASQYYRGFVDDLYKTLSIDTNSYIERLLVTYVGYAKIVCIDEWQAYLVAEGESWLLPSMHGVGKKGGNAPPVLGGCDSLFKKEQVLVSKPQWRKIREELERTRKVLRDMWEKGCET